MGGTGMAVVADIGRASEGNGAVLRPNILLNRHTHPAHPGSGRLVSSPSWAPACKLQLEKSVSYKLAGIRENASPSSHSLRTMHCANASTRELTTSISASRELFDLSQKEKK